MNTVSILGRKVLPDSFELTALLVVITLMVAFTQPVMAVCITQPTPTDFCKANANTVLNFSEMPGSLKCTPVPEPYIVDQTCPDSKASISPSIIKNKAAAIALGKMLFWDSQVGSDGIACASCHFQAGADSRIKNQINPGLRNASGELASDGTPIGNVFDFMNTYLNAGPGGKGPNYTLKKDDFPLRKYKEIPVEGQPLQADRNAEVVYDNDDVISSQGVYHSKFNELTPSGRKEICGKRFPTSGPDMPLFNVAGYSVRQVEPRNTPTVINAVYNFRNFWDGRANNVFNGLDPFGMRRPYTEEPSPTTEIYSKDANGTLSKKQITIYNASLASQAVGPALSDFEMSCGGKTFPELGRKMLTRKPLSKQTVDPTDSVLGPYAKTADRSDRESDSNAKGASGLKSMYTYKKLIQSAFDNAFWDVPDTQTIDGYKLIENNFSLFWGLAVQAYEATLVSDDSPFDQAINAFDILTIDTAEGRGLNLFLNQGKCVACHLGPEFTAASVAHVTNPTNDAIGKYTERMVMGDGGDALYDSGFYNIGVRPTKEDIGVGATDPYGNPLSFTRNAKKNSPNDPYIDNANISSLFPDPFQTNSDLFSTNFLGPIFSDDRDAVDGAFKTSTLRNVELTGPYFHNGGQATLEQVVQFYNRGGDRKDMFQIDNDPTITGCGGGGPLLTNGMVTPDLATGLIDSSGFFLPPDNSGLVLGQASNIAPDMAGTKELLNTICGQRPQESLNLMSSDVDDLVAFMKALTDERVRLEKAPFDHPSLTIPNGHVGDENMVKYKKSTNQAQQQTIELPAVGAAGREAKGLLPLQSFDSQLQ